jgi:hypothetical protein
MLPTAESRSFVGVDQYYVVSGKSVANKEVNLETLAREMGLLEPWETLAKSSLLDGESAGY